MSGRKPSIVLISVLALVAFASIGTATVHALDLKYAPPCLENVTALSGSGFGPCSSAAQSSTLLGYIDNMYRFLIGIAGILALGIIVAGAIRISVSPGSVDQQNEGRSMITSAILGIVLVFASYLILNTINPSLTTLKYPEAPQAPVPVTPGGGNGPVSCNLATIYPIPSTRSDATLRAELAKSGIQVNKSDCSNLCTDLNCTSLDYMPFSTIQNLVQVKNGCDTRYGNCSVVVTGGTEVAPHQTHGPDKPVVDLRWDANLARYLKNDYAGNINQICTTADPARLQYRIGCANYNESVDQLHVSFK